jgi:hypothetical protein
MANHLGFHDENIRVYRHRNLTIIADRRSNPREAIVEWSGEIGKAKNTFANALLNGVLIFTRSVPEKIHNLTNNQLVILQEIEEDIKKFFNK